MSALIGVLGLLAGLALGWYSRRVSGLCDSCGYHMACTQCGRRPSWIRVRHRSRVAP